LDERFGTGKNPVKDVGRLEVRSWLTLEMRINWGDLRVVRVRPRSWLRRQRARDGLDRSHGVVGEVRAGKANLGFRPRMQSSSTELPKRPARREEGREGMAEVVSGKGTETRWVIAEPEREFAAIATPGESSTGPCG
jgi:hypothetical protein